MNKNN